MAQHVLPVDSDSASYSFDVDLSGKLYRLALAWNTRAAWWTLDIADDADTPLVTGIRLVADTELIRLFALDALPPGSLYCVDTSGQGVDPTDTDLGSRVILVYDDGLA